MEGLPRRNFDDDWAKNKHDRGKMKQDRGEMDRDRKNIIPDRVEINLDLWMTTLNP